MNVWTHDGFRICVLQLVKICWNVFEIALPWTTTASTFLHFAMEERKKAIREKTNFGDLNSFSSFCLKKWFESCLFGLNDFSIIINIIINLLNNIFTFTYNEIKWNCILKINTFTNLWIMNVIFNNYYYLYKLLLLLLIVICKIQ